VGTVAIVAVAASRGAALHWMICGLFGTTAAAVFTASVALHSSRSRAVRLVWLRLDYTRSTCSSPAPTRR